jgi:hypothetical protein
MTSAKRPEGGPNLSRRGRRLIDGDSLDSYLETLAAKQVLAEAKPAEVG